MVDFDGSQDNKTTNAKLDQTDNDRTSSSTLNDMDINKNNSNSRTTSNDLQLDSPSGHSIISQTSNSSKHFVVQRQLTPVRIDDHPLKPDFDKSNVLNFDASDNKNTPINHTMHSETLNKLTISPNTDNSNGSRSQSRSRATSISRSIVSKRRSLIQPLIAHNHTGNSINNNSNNGTPVSSNVAINSAPLNDSNNVFFNKRNSSQLSLGNTSNHADKTRFHSRENSDSISFDYSNLSNLDSTTDPLIHTNAIPKSKTDNSLMITTNNGDDISELLKNLALKESKLFEKKQEIEDLKRKLQHQEKLYEEQANDLRILKESVSKHLNEKSNIMINQSPNVIHISSTPSKKISKNHSKKKLVDNKSNNKINDDKQDATNDSTLEDAKLQIAQPNSHYNDKNNITTSLNKENSTLTSYDDSYNVDDPDDRYDKISPIRLRQRNKSRDNNNSNNKSKISNIKSKDNEQQRIGSSNSIYEDNTSLPPISPQLPRKENGDSMWSKSISMLNQFDQLMQNELEKSLNWEGDKDSSDEDSDSNNTVNQYRSITDSFLPDASVTASIWNFVNDVKTNILSVVQEEEPSVSSDNDTMKEFKTLKKNNAEKEVEMSQFM